ncbi:class I SAM-dependent methyltransferase [Halothiobacillus sp.]|uniref:class I SAM-dependent methyltransferase n=1 Tax=Halothiobacillus sp. TaxID=1891311 RepID=UPI002AD42117|nr:class I SAM-dependent methyltransferase [Halothiobacillus sp.]
MGIFEDPAGHSAIESISAWYQTPMGARIGRDLTQCIVQHADDAFGYHAVVMGATLPLGSRLRIRHVTQVSPSLAAMAGPVPGADNEYPATGMVADFTALPIASESADLVIALHVLENLRQPHALLREMDRIVRPEGRLLIVGVNPVSLFPVMRLLGRTCHTPLLRGHRHAAWRLVDLLRVLGYEINAVEHLGGLCPTCRVRRYDRFRRVREWSLRWAGFLHGFYVIDATRRESTPTAIRPSFRLRELMPQKAGSRVAGSTTAGARLNPHPNRR